MFQGMGQASLLRSSQGFLQWISFSVDNLTIATNNSNTAGTRIVDIGGFSTDVRVETAGPSTIRVHNVGPFVATGSVSLMW